MTAAPDPRLPLSPVEREQVARIRSTMPAAAARVELRVRYVVERLIEVFEGLVTDEAEVDVLLGDLTDRLRVSERQDPAETEVSDPSGPATDLLIRAVLADLREEVVRRLLARPESG